jgi:hypothetical protein
MINDFGLFPQENSMQNQPETLDNIDRARRAKTNAQTRFDAHHFEHLTDPVVIIIAIQAAIADIESLELPPEEANEYMSLLIQAIPTSAQDLFNMHHFENITDLMIRKYIIAAALNNSRRLKLPAPLVADYRRLLIAAKTVTDHGITEASLQQARKGTKPRNYT